MPPNPGIDAIWAVQGWVAIVWNEREAGGDSERGGTATIAPRAIDHRDCPLRFRAGADLHRVGARRSRYSGASGPLRTQGVRPHGVGPYRDGADRHPADRDGPHRPDRDGTALKSAAGADATRDCPVCAPADGAVNPHLPSGNKHRCERGVSCCLTLRGPVDNGGQCRRRLDASRGDDWCSEPKRWIRRRSKRRCVPHIRGPGQQSRA